MTLGHLKETLHYNPNDGIFRWAISKIGASLWSIAGTTDAQGYRKIMIDRNPYMAHRLAWFYMYDEWPEAIDHINGDKSDNAISNLRECTTSQNQANRTAKGFCFVRKTGRYKAVVRHKKKDYYLGEYNTKEEAIGAYRNKHKELNKEFSPY